MSQHIGRDGKSQQQRAELRHCMSCEWIYKGAADCCPKCSWPSYGAHYVSGSKAYRFARTQKPWFDKKMADYAGKLYEEIAEQAQMKDRKEGV